jgi:hypothetical protein
MRHIKIDAVQRCETDRKNRFRILTEYFKEYNKTDYPNRPITREVLELEKEYSLLKSEFHGLN